MQKRIRRWLCGCSEKCVQNTKSKQPARDWPVYLPVCFQDRTSDRLWEPLTRPLHQISIFHLTLLLWQRPQATGPRLDWPTQPNPETQKAHLRARVLTCLRAAGVSFCLSHLLTYLHQVIWVTSRSPRSEVQETSQDMDTEVRVGMERWERHFIIHENALAHLYNRNQITSRQKRVTK